MAIFGNDTFRMQRELRHLTSENADLKGRLEAASRDLWNTQQDLIRAQDPLSAKESQQTLSEVTDALRAVVPSLPQAPTYSQLRAANTPQKFAQAIHSLLRHAHRIGALEPTKAGSR